MQGAAMQSLSDGIPGHKHPCPDCRMCQNCSESRCRSCRGPKKVCSKHRLSLQEQIALYDKLNPNLSAAIHAPQPYSRKESR